MAKAQVSIVESRGRLHVKVDLANGLTEWPILHFNGVLAWDHPEIVPQYAKVLARKAALKIRDNCAHPPARLYMWTAYDGVQCVACCDCGKVLMGAIQVEAG